MRRRSLSAVWLAAVVVVASSGVASADVCDHIPSVGIGPVSTRMPCKAAAHPVKTIKDVGNAVTHPGDTAKDIATAPFRAAGDQVMEGVTTWVANGAGWLVEQAGELIGDTTTPRIESPWFLRQYAVM